MKIREFDRMMSRGFFTSKKALGYPSVNANNATKI